VTGTGEPAASRGQVHLWTSSGWKLIFSRPWDDLKADISVLDDIGNAEAEAFASDIQNLLKFSFETASE